MPCVQHQYTCTPTRKNANQWQLALVHVLCRLSLRTCMSGWHSSSPIPVLYVSNFYYPKDTMYICMSTTEPVPEYLPLRRQRPICVNAVMHACMAYPVQPMATPWNPLFQYSWYCIVGPLLSIKCMMICMRWPSISTAHPGRVLYSSVHVNCNQ